MIFLTFGKIVKKVRNVSTSAFPFSIRQLFTNDVNCDNMDLGKRDEVCRLFNKFEVKWGVLLLVAFYRLRRDGAAYIRRKEANHDVRNEDGSQ